MSFFVALFTSCFVLAVRAQDHSATGVNQARDVRQGFHQDLAWSPDGSKISFSWNGEGNFEIYVMAADGSAVTNLTHNQASDRYATWSSDGRKIAFASDRAAKDKIDIYVMDADGSNPVRLTHDGASNSFPSWSKDSRQIAFMSQRDSHWQICIMNADGSNQRRLTHSNANDENPSFSPDSANIIFESNRDGERRDQLYTIRTDGSGLKRLTHDENNNVFPSFSPDGEWIIFGLTRPDAPGSPHKIYMMKKDGTGQKQIADSAFFARWSPNRDRIAFIGGAYPSTQIYVMKPDGSGMKQLPLK
jgi:TolB protein